MIIIIINIIINRLRSFESGVLVIQSLSHSEQAVIDSTIQLVLYIYLYNYYNYNYISLGQTI